MSTSRTPAAVFGEYSLPFHMLCRIVADTGCQEARHFQS